MNPERVEYLWLEPRGLGIVENHRKLGKIRLGDPGSSTSTIQRLRRLPCMCCFKIKLSEHQHNPLVTRPGPCSMRSMARGPKLRYISMKSHASSQTSKSLNRLPVVRSLCKYSFKVSSLISNVPRSRLDVPFMALSTGKGTDFEERALPR